MYVLKSMNTSLNLSGLNQSVCFSVPYEDTTTPTTMTTTSASTSELETTLSSTPEEAATTEGSVYNSYLLFSIRAL